LAAAFFCSGIAVVFASVASQALAEEAQKEITATGPDGVAARARVIDCATKALESYPPQTLNFLNWRFTAAISEKSGLVLRDISLGRRYMAEEMQLAFYDIVATGLPAAGAHCYLKPDSKDAICRSRLVGFRSEADDIVARVHATYVIDNLPAGNDRCLIIEQAYEFHKEFQAIPFHCEPFGKAPCARFRPMLSYRALKEWRGTPGFLIRTAQRIHFLVDKSTHNRAALAYDCALLELSRDCLLPPRPIVWVGGNPLDKDVVLVAIIDGKLGDIDNFHQTPIGAVDGPGFTHFGCPECAHMHWRWSEDIQNFIGKHMAPGLGDSGQYPQFGDGKPLIPERSRQSVEILITHDNRADFRSPDELITGPIGDAPPYFWYLARSSALTDRFFTHGGFFNSHGMNLLAANRGGGVEQPHAEPGEVTRALLEGDEAGDREVYARPNSMDFIFNFFGRKRATFDLFCVAPKSDIPENLKSFELAAADSVDGPWRMLRPLTGSFETRQPSESSPPGTCQEFPLPRTTARFLRMTAKTSFDGRRPELGIRMSPVYLYGSLDDSGTP
jgi:hypothetical protein